MHGSNCPRVNKTHRPQGDMNIDRTHRLHVGEGINRPASLFTLQVYHSGLILSTPFFKINKQMLYWSKCTNFINACPNS